MNKKTLKFTQTHEWVSLEEGKTLYATVGITHAIQGELGPIVFVELPKEGASVQRGETAVVLESTKAAIDIETPLSGTILSINRLLLTLPETINASAEKEGWFFRLALTRPDELHHLLDHPLTTSDLFIIRKS